MIINMVVKQKLGASIRQRLEDYSMPVTECGCWIWLGSTSPNGYGRLGVDYVPKYAHRLSYEEYIGPIPEGMHVLHRCDTPPCINPEHLFLGTHADNMADMVAKGRGNKVFGEDVWNSVISSETALSIAYDLEHSTASMPEIAIQNKTTLGTVGYIAYHGGWASIIGHAIVRPRECKRTKLTEEIVSEIVLTAKTTDLNQREIGNVFGIDHSAVSYILCGRSWGAFTGIERKRSP